MGLIFVSMEICDALFSIVLMCVVVFVCKSQTLKELCLCVNLKP